MFSKPLAFCVRTSSGKVDFSHLFLLHDHDIYYLFSPWPKLAGKLHYAISYYQQLEPTDLNHPTSTFIIQLKYLK